jgi:hypothetical protein
MREKINRLQFEPPPLRRHHWPIFGVRDVMEPM